MGNAMTGHRNADPEFAREARAERETVSPELADLHEQLAALDRITARHPELADHNAKLRVRLMAQIKAMET